MRTHVEWTKYPRWVLSLASGIPMGIGMGIVTKVDGSGWHEAAIDAVGFGIVSGLVIGFALDRRRRVERAIGGNLPDFELKVARRAAAGGPVPSDPETCTAAFRLTSHQLERARRYRKPRRAGATIALIGGLALGFGASPWFFLLVPALIFGLVATWNLPRNLERRAEALSAAADAQPRD